MPVVAEEPSTALNQKVGEGDEVKVEAEMALHPNLDRRFVAFAVVENQVDLANSRGLAIEHRK